MKGAMEPSDSAYNQKILDHFLHPRNVGEIENADGYAKIGDPNCGDFIKVWLRIENETIVDFKYKVFGCWGAISTTSVVSELAIGKSISEATKITDDDVVRALGGIPENKQHCSLLGVQGLRAALADFVLKDNHRKYDARLAQYRSMGYDIAAIREKMVSLLSDLSNGAQILDVGCGKGHLALAIARSGRSCISIDISDEEIYYARLNAIFFNVDDRIDLQLQDARQLKFESQSFDAVVSAALFHHLIHPRLVLNEMLRVCKSPGKIVISDLNEQGQEAVATLHRQEGKEHVMLGWSMEQIKNWFEGKGFQPVVFEEGGETILCVDV
jgi:nitrogen fixation NifU-like protein